MYQVRSELSLQDIEIEFDLYTFFVYSRSCFTGTKKNVVETENEKNVFPGKKKCITHENDCMLVGFRSAYEMIAYHN